MSRPLPTGPARFPTGFSFPPYDVMSRGSVTGSADVLWAVLAVRSALLSSGGASDVRDLDVAIRQELLRFAATGSKTLAEAQAKVELLSAFGTAGLTVTAWCKTMLEAAVGLEALIWVGPLPEGVSELRPSVVSPLSARIIAAAGDPVPRDQEQAVAAATSAIRSRADLAVALATRDGIGAAKLLVRPAQMLGWRLARLLDRAERLDRDIEGFFQIGDLSRGRIATTLLNDLTLTIAASEPGSRAEALRCASYLTSHLAVFGLMALNLTEMLGASVDDTCRTWNIEVPEAAADGSPGPTH